MADLTPAQWFDQFADLDHEQRMDEHKQWCWRHWAPCPVLGANGLGACTELMRIWLDELAPKGSYSPAARNRQLERTGRICCTLGDERMHEIWGHWGPAKAEVPGNG